MTMSRIEAALTAAGLVLLAVLCYVLGGMLMGWAR